MSVNENSVLAVMNPFVLLLGGAAVCLLGFFCARRYRNTNDFGKSAKLFFPCMLILDAALVLFLNINVILTIGLNVCGFVTMALVSNHYFYH